MLQRQKKKHGNAHETTIYTGTVTSKNVGRSVLVRWDGASTSQKISTRKLSRVNNTANATVNAAAAAAANDDNPRLRTLRPRAEALAAENLAELEEEEENHDPVEKPCVRPC